MYMTEVGGYEVICEVGRVRRHDEAGQPTPHHLDSRLTMMPKLGVFRGGLTLRWSNSTPGIASGLLAVRVLVYSCVRAVDGTVDDDERSSGGNSRMTANTT